MNCPNCGAAVKEGKFCNYCGAKLPDDTKRVEVNINKKIEDVAEIRRASYEEQESLLKQKMMKRDLLKGRIKAGFLIAYIVITAVLVVPTFFHMHEKATTSGIVGMVMTALLILFAICYGFSRMFK